MSAAQQVKIRRIVWTGSIAAITVVGTIYGAGLKTNTQQQKQVQQVREATVEERMAHLEEQRGELIAKRIGLERKMKEIEMRALGATREESRGGLERKRG